MIPGTEVQVPKVQDVVAEVKSNSGDNSDNSIDNNNSNNIGNNDINSDSKSAKNHSNGQNKKKGKYSHKDNDDKDKEKNPNGTISDNKKKKRKKYVIYTENPAVCAEENVSIETKIVNEADIGMHVSDDSKSLNVIMSDKNSHSNIIDNTNSLIVTEELKKNEKEKNNIKKSDDLKLEIKEEKIRAEERKKDVLEKLKLESVLNSQKEEEEHERNEEEIELSRKGGRGTFSVGCLPKPLNCPKGNTLFPGAYL